MESHGFPQLPTGTMPEELGPLTTANNDSPFQESPDLTATGYVRVSVVPGIQANSWGVGIIPTSSGSESLDQDSTVIIPGMEPPSPSRWRCDPHADTLPMTHTPQPFVAEWANAGTGSYTSHTFTTTPPPTTDASSYIYIHCVSKKTSPTFLAITRESIDGFL